MSEPFFLSPDTQITFKDLQEVISTNQVSLVRPMLKKIENRVDKGYYAAGFISFEAAPAFDAAFNAHQTGNFPLLWFGIYAKKAISHAWKESAQINPAKAPWRSLVSQSAYYEAFDVLKNNIRQGNVYQVNLTFPLENTLVPSSRALLYHLFERQPVDYAAYIDTGDYDIISLSPELFWKLDGFHIVSKPMKGTRSRSHDRSRDLELARELQNSPKERAENLMIVDMVRNDLGRIAKIGSVKTDPLFELEDFRTVWQMTSTITAEVEADVPRIMHSLFPPASVTGAPKIKAVDLIHALEPHPRLAYCGAIGWWAPGRQACFNVAIRTLIRDKVTNSTRYSVGSGITWDSDREQEYNECLAKAAVLNI